MPISRFATPFVALFLGGSVSGEDWIQEISQRVYNTCHNQGKDQFPGVLNKNIALHKSVDASSTYNTGNPLTNLVDGNLNNFAHTNIGDNSWFEIDLGDDFILGSISVYNRKDAPITMMRANNFVVKLLDKERTQLLQLDGPQDMSTVDVHTFDLFSEHDEYDLLANNKWCFLTRYVRIQLQSKDYLNLAEVEVYPVDKFGLPTTFLSEERVSEAYGCAVDDQPLILGDLSFVDKITDIKVYGGDRDFCFKDLCYKLIHGMDVTYRKANGEGTEKLPIGYISNGAVMTHHVEIKEGEYLTKVLPFRQYMSCKEWDCNGLWAITGIRFCKSTKAGEVCFDNGEKKGVGAYDEKQPNFINEQSISNGVIKALRGCRLTIPVDTSEDILYLGIHSVAAVYEVNKVSEVRLAEYTEKSSTLTRETDNVIDTPDAVQVVDNYRGNTDLEAQLKFSETVETTETTLISNTKSFSQSSTTEQSNMISMSVSHKFSAGILGAGAETTVDIGSEFSYGSSLTESSESSNTVEEESSKTFTETFERNYFAIAQPGEVVEVALYYDLVQYEIGWTGAVDVCFQADVANCISGDKFGVAVEGSTFGSQPIHTFEIRANVTKHAKTPDDQQLLHLQAKRAVIKDMVQTAGQVINLRGSNGMQTTSDQKERYSKLASYLDELDTKILELIQEKDVVPDP